MSSTPQPTDGRGRGRLSGTAVGAGAAADLAVLVPVVAGYAVCRRVGIVSSDTGVIVTALLGALVAPVVGGMVAGRRAPAAPLTNGAASAGTAAVVYVGFRLVDATIRGASIHAGSIVILVMLDITLGLLGGLAGFRSRTARDRSWQTPRP